MDINEIHIGYLKFIDKIVLNELPEINLKEALFNETRYVITRSKKIALYYAFQSILMIRSNFRISLIDSKDINQNSADLLFFVENYNRVDHDSYWKEIRNLFQNRSELLVEHLDRKNKIAHINIMGALSNLYRFIHIFKQLYPFRNVWHRLYIAAQCLEQFNIIKYVKDIDIKPKILVTFFDSGFYENVLVQYFKKIGCITITNQHSQPIFYSKNKNLVIQSQILNFKSNYYIAKGLFTVEQFIKAGYHKENFLICGDILYNNKVCVNTQRNYFGVFLDASEHEKAKSANIAMIRTANKISHDLNYKFYVKVHPMDKIEEYIMLIDKEYGEVFDLKSSSIQVISKIDFGLLHMSSIYLDLIKNRVRPFRYNSGIEFPLVTDEGEKYSNDQELINKIFNWLKKGYSEREEYFSSKVNYYIAQCDAKKEIFSSIMKLLKNK